jgi:hypothetical protein
MAKFKEFKSNELNQGIQYLNFYPNGYGVSIVKHSFSYGSSSGLWEMAVLQGTAEKWNLTYDTEITSDVIGYLNDNDVDELCDRVEALSNYTDNI